MIPRILDARLKSLAKAFPLVLITGARQVGKTTLVELQNPHTIFTFDPVQDLAGARRDPDLFLQNIATPAFLDEVQYAPEVLASLKRLVDKHRGKKGQFYLSGSQNLSVLKEVAESLAGRVVLCDLYPLCYREVTSAPFHGYLESLLHDSASRFSNADTPFPNTAHVLWRGGMPGLLELSDNLVPTYFDSYLRTYVERDVRVVAQVRELQEFGRFFRILAAHTAQEQNPNEIGRELGVDRKTALLWKSIAEATFQWISIPAFSRNPTKRIAGKAKGYFTDSGFLCALQSIPSPQALMGHPLIGRIFESHVVMEIIKRIQGWDTKPQLYHFRTYAGAEVDLILEYNGILYPIEIKWSTKPSRQDCLGFQSLHEAFPNERFGCGLVLCNTEIPYEISKGIWAVPWWGL